MMAPSEERLDDQLTFHERTFEWEVCASDEIECLNIVRR